MKVQITDPSVFSSINPSAMMRFLNANGWIEVRRVANELAVLAKRDSDRNRHLVWMPFDDQNADYASMVSRVITTVAEAEDKSELQILDDVETVAIGDIIRFRAFNPIDEHEHTLPLKDGIDLLINAKKLATAAAASVIQKRPVHPRSPTSRVTEFVQNLRLGQTERGSYLVRLISPLDAPNTDGAESANMLPNMPDSEPFSRQATLELVRGLHALREAALENSRSGRFQFQPFLSSVNRGVSANLCEALFPDSGRDSLAITALEISVTWSYAIGRTDNLPSEPIRFDSTVLPYIKRAAESFRLQNPEYVSLTGWVNMLERDVSSGGPGIIRLIARVDKRTRSIRMELEDSDYDRAIQAHRDGSLVSVVGELVVMNNFYYRLNNPKGLHVVDQEGLFDPLDDGM